jgi:hypothetical protein
MAPLALEEKSDKNAIEHFGSVDRDGQLKEFPLHIQDTLWLLEQPVQLRAPAL